MDKAENLRRMREAASFNARAIHNWTAIPIPERFSVTQHVTPAPLVTPDVTLGDHECPVCGFIHHKPLSATERKRKSRGRG